MKFKLFLEEIDEIYNLKTLKAQNLTKNLTQKQKSLWERIRVIENLYQKYSLFTSNNIKITKKNIFKKNIAVLIY